MIPYSAAMTLYLLMVGALIALVVSLIVGAITAVCLRLTLNGLWKDALLGVAGFMAVFFASFCLEPRPITNGNGPATAALIAAGALAFVRELLRLLPKYRRRDLSR